MDTILSHLAVIALAIAGLVVAGTIHGHKQAKKPLICPMRSRCDLVTESPFSKFMGIHNEQLGMAYYALVALLYAATLAYPALFGAMTAVILFALPAVAFLFSVYLVLLQAFVIKEWCAWCLASATIATLIFFLAIAAMPAGVL